jgi:dihydrofolate reductase
LQWDNTRLVDQDPVEAVRSMKEDDVRPLRTIGSLTLCRSLIEAGLFDRFRVVVFPVITGSTVRERIHDGYPDVALHKVPAGRSTVGCSSSSTCPPVSPVRRIPVGSPEQVGVPAMHRD